MFEKKSSYRPNVGIVIINSQGKLMWCRRRNHDGWQFPQGGIDKNETSLDAVLRETEEEVGLTKNDFDIEWESKGWFYYKVPEERRKRYFVGKNDFIGQKQKWYVAKLKEGKEKNIDLSKNIPIEFDHYIWVNYWYPLNEVVHFKKEVYRSLLIEFLPKYINLTKQD